jgi:hypothetical protein
VATRVGGVPPPELFAAVARELGLLLEVDATHVGRFEPDGTATVVGGWNRAGEQVPVGTRVDPEGESVAGHGNLQRRSANTDGRLADEQAALRRVATLVARGSPREELFAAVVEEVVWGVMTLASTDHPLPADRRTRSRQPRRQLIGSSQLIGPSWFTIALPACPTAVLRMRPAGFLVRRG